MHPLNDTGEWPRENCRRLMEADFLGVDYKVDKFIPNVLRSWVGRHRSYASLPLCSFAEDETICYYEGANVNFKPPPQKQINFPTHQHIH